MTHTLHFHEVDHVLHSQGSALGAAELHGALIGLACVINRPGLEHWLDMVYGGDEGAPKLDEDALTLLDTLRTESLDQLADPQCGFALLLPAEDEGLARRTVGLANWATGCLAAMGSTGLATWPPEVEEFLRDLGQIAAIGHVVDETADAKTENDLTELIEYVRVGAMLAHTELVMERDG